MQDHSNYRPRQSSSLNALREQIDADIGDRYQGLVFVGDGGAATVWRAFDLESQSWVAIKRLVVPEESGRSYYRELATLFRLNHRHINKLYTIKESNHTARYLVLEFCAGGHLGQLLTAVLNHEARGNLERLCQMTLIQVAAALEYAHDLDFIHRDLKPANILLSRFQGADIDENLELKVSDFGLAQGTFPDDSVGGSSLKGLSGTPIYMAPELFSGQGATAASDIYSVGVIAYELLHGRPPFLGTAGDLAQAHCYKDPDFNEVWSSDWTSCLTQLMAKDPGDRPSAKE
ncbi:MAG: serine/threonine-protein kinase, partial [Planctomycetota bacterium]|nr:serine/threonine-protein kinase [Planctomycetota bacterium]